MTESPQNYWMVRTEGGKYFTEFYNHKYVGISWNDFIDFEDIKNLTVKELGRKIKEHYEDEKYPGGAAGQIKTFVDSMRVGDLIVIPGYRSKEIAFGVIKSEPYIETSTPREKCPFRKRRRVKWLDRLSKSKLDVNLFSLLNSHRAITNANPYSIFINRMLFPFYILGDTAHLTLRVVSEEPILFNDLATIMELLKCISKDYEEVTGVYIDIESIKLRASFNSPGPIEFFGSTKVLIWVLIILHFLVGGNIELPYVKWQTDGLINQALRYIKEDKKIDLQRMTIEMKRATENKIEIPNPENTVILNQLNLDEAAFGETEKE